MDKAEIARFVIYARLNFWMGMSCLTSVRMSRNLWRAAFGTCYSTISEFLKDTGQTVTFETGKETPYSSRDKTGEILARVLSVTKEWGIDLTNLEKTHLLEPENVDERYSFSLTVQRRKRNAIERKKVHLGSWSSPVTEPLLEFNLLDFLRHLAFLLKLKRDCGPSEVGPKSWNLGRYVDASGKEYPVYLSLLRTGLYAEADLSWLSTFELNSLLFPSLARVQAAFSEHEKADISELIHLIASSNAENNILIVPSSDCALYSDITERGGFVLTAETLFGISPDTGKLLAKSSVKDMILGRHAEKANLTEQAISADLPENLFMLAPGGEVWRVRFQGGPLLILRKTQSDGMALVACLLRTPGKKWEEKDLFLAASGGYIEPENKDKAAAKTYGTGGAARDLMMTKAGIKKMMEIRDGLQEEVNLHNSGEIKLDLKTFEDKEENLAELNSMLNEVTRKEGKVATIKDDHDKRVKYIGMNLERVYLRIAKAELEKEPSHNRKRKVDKTDINARSTPLAFHLSQCIAPYSKKLYYCYEPDIEITWET